MNTGETLQTKLHRFLMTHRATPTALGQSPPELLMNRQPRQRFSAPRAKSSKQEVKIFIARNPIQRGCKNGYEHALCAEVRIKFHRRKMSTHALEKMTHDRFRVMSLAPRRKCPRNVVQMKVAMAAFFGSDSVANFLPL